MALIDALPKFRHKPLDLEPVPTKLVPRSTEEPVTPVKVDVPKVAPVANRTLSGAPVTRVDYVTKKRLVLPDVYKDFNPLAEAISDSTIINPKAQAAIIAQMGLEKGWKTPGDFNYGNIIAGKTWKGSTVMRGDTDAAGNKITQNFRQYGSPKEFLNDYLSLLKSQYPDAYAELHSEDFNVDRFGAGLVGGKYKYAENPKYTEEMKRVYESVNARLNQNK